MTIAIRPLAIALGLLAATGFAGLAQAQTTTDEARMMAAQALAQQRLRVAFRKPALDPVAPGDYRAQAHNDIVEANYRAMVQDVLAYGQGARSTPLALNSQDSARAEAARVLREQQVAALHGLLTTSAEAHRDLEEGLQTRARVAAR